jgi:hypothetical protein
VTHSSQSFKVNIIITRPKNPHSRDAVPVEVQVLLTPLDFIPGGRVRQYLGPVQLHFIKVKQIF